MSTLRDRLDSILSNKQNGNNLSNVIRREVPKELLDKLRARGSGEKGALSEQLYLWLGKPVTTCQACNGKTNFNTFYTGYHKYCPSRICAGVAPKRTLKREAKVFPKILESIFVKHKDVQTMRSKSVMRLIRLSNEKRHAKIIEMAKKHKLKQAHILYHMYVDKSRGKCVVCNAFTKFISLSEGYLKYCSKSCGSLAHNRMLAATGRVKESVAKAKAMNNVRYGVDNPMQNKMISRMAHKTRAENDRKLSPKARKARAKKMRRKYIATCLERYNTEHPMQNSAIAYKIISSSYRNKIVNINGKKFKCLGYEGTGLRFIAKHHEVGNIENRIKNLPRILYTFKGKQHYYFPDAMAGNTVYEVKSLFTSGLLGKGSDKFKMLKAKGDATREAGYRFICVVCNGKGKVIFSSKLLKDKSHYVNKYSDSSKWKR